MNFLVWKMFDFHTKIANFRCGKKIPHRKQEILVWNQIFSTPEIQFFQFLKFAYYSDYSELAMSLPSHWGDTIGLKMIQMFFTPTFNFVYWGFKPFTANFI